MTLQETLKIKFQDKLKNDAQLKEFNNCLDLLGKHYEKKKKKAYNGVDASFILLEKINKIDFSKNYNYWLYDEVTGLFFNNIHARHEDFRRVLLILHIVVSEWKDEYAGGLTGLLNNKRVDLEGVYTALGLGFYATGARTLGGSSQPRVVCNENLKMNENTFLRNYILEPSFFSKEDASIEINKHLTELDG